MKPICPVTAGVDNDEVLERRGGEDLGEREGAKAEDDQMSIVSRESEEDNAELKVKIGPRGPPRAELEKHEVSHDLFRSWCPYVFAGRSTACPHKVSDKDRLELPRCSFDYGFLG